MKEMQKCPKCGSERIWINGVLQKKKGAMYYLSGAFAADLGTRHGQQMYNAVKGIKENARCENCGYTWNTGKETPTPEKPEPVPAAAAAKPAAAPRPRFCGKCGGAIEPGDVFCVKCGAKL